MDGLAGRPYLASGLCFASEDIFRGIPDSYAGQESFTLYERYYTALPQLKSEHIEQMGSLFSANIGITVLVRDAQKINSPRDSRMGHRPAASLAGWDFREESGSREIPVRVTARPRALLKTALDGADPRKNHQALLLAFDIQSSKK